MRCQKHSQWRRRVKAVSRGITPETGLLSSLTGRRHRLTIQDCRPMLQPLFRAPQEPVALLLPLLQAVTSTKTQSFATTSPCANRLHGMPRAARAEIEAMPKCSTPPLPSSKKSPLTLLSVEDTRRINQEAKRLMIINVGLNLERLPTSMQATCRRTPAKTLTTLPSMMKKAATMAELLVVMVETTHGINAIDQVATLVLGARGDLSLTATKRQNCSS